MSTTQSIGTVMVVDDEEIDHFLYKRVLTRSGLVGNIIMFTYPDEALEYLKSTDREPIDVLLLDINMPRMTGFEFLDKATAELGDRLAKLLVIVLSTSLNPEDIERAYRYPVVKEYINKPLSMDKVESIAQLFMRIR